MAAELWEATKGTLERVRKMQPDHEKLLVALKIKEPGSLPLPPLTSALSTFA